VSGILQIPTVLPCHRTTFFVGITDLTHVFDLRDKAQKLYFKYEKSKARVLWVVRSTFFPGYCLPMKYGLIKPLNPD
jgi:hypothetical protein